MQQFRRLPLLSLIVDLPISAYHRLFFDFQSSMAAKVINLEAFAYHQENRGEMIIMLEFPGDFSLSVRFAFQTTTVQR